MSGSNVIELNGKKYDTRTGQLLAKAKPVAPASAHVTPKAAPAKAKPARSHGSTTPAPVQPARRPARNIDGIKHSPQQATRSRSANHAKRETQRSHTLMRRGIPQPQTTKAVTVKQPATPAIIPSASPLYSIDEARLKRAQHVPQDKRVSRFAVIDPRPAVQPEPAAIVAAPVVAPAPLMPPAPVVKPSPLEQAVANATSHTRQKVALTPHKAHHKIARKLHVKPRTVTTAAAVLLTVGFAGLVAHQQMPRIQTKIASSRAGVSASLPSYAPAGFNLARGIDYQPGQVTMTYASKTGDGRSYTVTQAESFWTSDSLRENYLDTLGTDYQTIQQNGKTVYLYDGNATWVDGGIWYRVQAEQAHLSSQQLSDIVSSL